MCIFLWFILSFFLIVCLSVTVKWLAVKTASEITYTVSDGALNSTQSNPIRLKMICSVSVVCLSVSLSVCPSVCLFVCRDFSSEWLGRYRGLSSWTESCYYVELYPVYDGFTSTTASALYWRCKVTSTHCGTGQCVIYLLDTLLLIWLLCWVTAFKKGQSSVVWNWIGMKFGGIVFFKQICIDWRSQIFD